MRELLERSRVCEIARSWLGTPYGDMLRRKGVGADCAQLLIGVFSEALPEVVPPDFDTGFYPHDWMLHRSEERFLKIVERFARKMDRAPLPGDVALYKYGRCISHGAIVLDWPVVIHAVRSSKRVLCDDSDKGELAWRFRGVWSLYHWA